MQSQKSKLLLACGLLVMMSVVGCEQEPSEATMPASEAAMTSGDEGLAVRVVPDEAAQRVDVFVGDDLFTAYLYTDTLTVLKKPVLWPIVSASGAAVTRSFPLDPKPGERTDHPHHIGYWLNYGDVNKLDFWNNSDAIPAERADEMGTIRHREVTRAEGGAARGELDVTMDWLKPDGTPILREDTRFVFHAMDDARIIDRITTLTALDEAVAFNDNKEGMLGLRLTRALEMPTDEPITLTDASGMATEVPVLNNDGVTGHYRNSEGIEGYPDVWGKRARWLTLSGVVDGKPVTLALLDHPQNVGYPTYWHARDYGLFAANPLGQAVFSEGAETLNFSLDAGAATTFRHRLVVFEGEAASDAVEAQYDDFVGEGTGM